MVRCLGRLGKHDAKQENSRVPDADGNVSHRQHVSDEDEEEMEDLGICCLSGCLTTIAVGILFFLALPTGILLCVFASSNNDPEVLAVGIVLAVIPVLSLPLIVIVLYNRRRIRRLRKRKVSNSPVHQGTNNNRF